MVFNTEALTPLFERVIIASGTSNRQTKALASSVRETVKKRGLPVLRTEGEDNGEWIIVDCGAAVAHIMQPAIRDYYHLEELWGAKPVKLKGALESHRGKPLPKATVGDGAARAAPKKTAPPVAAAWKKPVAAPARRSAARKPPGAGPRAAAKIPAKAPAKAPARAPARAPAKAAAKVRARAPAKATAKRAASGTKAAAPGARKSPAGKPLKR